MKVMHAIDDDVRAATENRIGFKFYPGAVQGDEKDVLRKIRNGQLHGGGFSGFGLGAVAPEYRVMELRSCSGTSRKSITPAPSSTRSSPTRSSRRASSFWLGRRRFRVPVLQRSDHDARRAAAGQDVDVVGDTLAEIFFKAFAVSPIPLALPDVLTSLQMGVIDAVYSSPLACVALQWFTRVKYMSNVPITYGFGRCSCPKRRYAVRIRRRGNAETNLPQALEDPRGQDARGERRGDTGDEEGGRDPSGSQTRRRKGVFHDGTGRVERRGRALYPEDLLQRVTALVDGYRADPKAAKRAP